MMPGLNLKTYLVDHDVSECIVLVVMATTLILIVITLVFRLFSTSFDAQRGTINNWFPIFWVPISTAASTAATVRALRKSTKDMLPNHSPVAILKKMRAD
jgi:hypothetical protein